MVSRASFAAWQSDGANSSIRNSAVGTVITELADVIAKFGGEIGGGTCWPYDNTSYRERAGQDGRCDERENVEQRRGEGRLFLALLWRRFRIPVLAQSITFCDRRKVRHGLVLPANRALPASRRRLAAEPPRNHAPPGCIDIVEVLGHG